jgi:hypothetical protein
MGRLNLIMLNINFAWTSVPRVKIIRFRSIIHLYAGLGRGEVMLTHGNPDVVGSSPRGWFIPKTQDISAQKQVNCMKERKVSLSLFVKKKNIIVTIIIILLLYYNYSYSCIS